MCQSCLSCDMDIDTVDGFDDMICFPQSTWNPGTTLWLQTKVREKTRSFFDLQNKCCVAESPSAFSLWEGNFVKSHLQVHWVEVTGLVLP